MRIKDDEKVKVKNKILEFLKKQGNGNNLSEIGRGIGKAPPTVLKYVKELATENKVVIIDKKSMKLIKIKRGR